MMLLMRFCWIFCVFIVLMGVYSAPALAIPVIDNTHIGTTSAEAKNTRDKIDEENEENKEDRAKASKENTTGRALATEQLTKNGDGRAAQDAHLAKGVQNTQTANDTLNLEDAMCSEASAAQGFADAIESAEAAFEPSVEANMAVTNAETGTPAENGRIDYNVQLYDTERPGVCNPQGWGGNEPNCAGPGGNGHLTTSTFFLPLAKNIRPGGVIDRQLEYLQKMLFSRVNSNINADLLQSPGTEVKSIIVESDRVKAAQGTAMAAFHHLKAQRAPSRQAKSKQWMEVTMKEHGFDGGNIQAMLGDKPSLEAQLDFIGRRVYAGEKWVQTLVQHPHVAQLHTPVYLGWNNMLLYEIYRLLQVIALNTGQTVAQNIDNDYQALESRIRAVNARQ